MKKSPLFADTLRFLPYKFLSDDRIRAFFIRRSGLKEESFSFSGNLCNQKRRLVILPRNLGLLSVFLPFLLEQIRDSDHNDVMLLCENRFLPLFKALDLEHQCVPIPAMGFRYGEPPFQMIESQLRSHLPEVTLMLEPKPSLLQLYLAKACGASYRVGINCEAHYPFLNISLRPGSDDSPYLFRSHLWPMFVAHGEDSVRFHPLTHDSRQLSSRHVILLNLEPPLQGDPWKPEELSSLVQNLDPRYRFLALTSEPSMFAPYSALLENLSIRLAPTTASFSAFLESLRQYQGLVTLNSAHAQLAMNVSRIPMLLISSPNQTRWIPTEQPDIHVLHRGSPLPSDPFAPLYDPV
ncbi:MAG TPA: hypothetical protein VLM37_11885 [Fibrobacteraceae bacterium]|nr:hypothetical protein [Fibrobacteraceae bacterium]